MLQNNILELKMNNNSKRVFPQVALTCYRISTSWARTQTGKYRKFWPTLSLTSL